MITIYCFSGSGHSLTVSKALSEMLGCTTTEITSKTAPSAKDAIAVVVFPVYCQNIPAIVKAFLKKINAQYTVLIATYGKKSYGNVLYEAKKIVNSEVIAGAYIPIGHTFLDGDHLFDSKYLLPIAERIRRPKKADIPKTPKNPFSNVFPNLRSRLGVRLTITERCNNCKLCEKACPSGAIQNGKINSECIRCLRCATICPQHAIEYKNRRILNKYLHSSYKDEYVLYL